MGTNHQRRERAHSEWTALHHSVAHWTFCGEFIQVPRICPDNGCLTGSVGQVSASILERLQWLE